MLADLNKHSNNVDIAIFSPDKTKILTASNNIIKIWFTPEAVYNWLKSPECKIRKLTEQETRALGIEDYY